MKSKNTLNAKTFNYSPGKSLNVRLRGKKLANGTISLYLDYYRGYKKGEDGKIKTQKKAEYLRIYLYDAPRTSAERKHNDEKLTLAQTIRSNRESDLQHNSEGLIAPYRKKSNFFDYCQAYQDRYQKKDVRMVKLAIAKFKEYTKESYLTPMQIDQPRVKGYRDFLLQTYNGETPNSIFARFKKILNSAVEEGLFTKSPASNITCRVPDGIPKEILTSDEIVKLSKAICGNSEVKHAFLLCLNTGLRFCDVADLKYKHITNGLIKKHQQKTGREVTVDLNPVAIKLIGELKEPEDYIFNLPSFTSCLKDLKHWRERAGITKKITWHSARHSFATILLMNKTDIKSVQSLLGHSKIEHTQRYTHVVNQLKSQAVNTLPDIEVD